MSGHSIDAPCNGRAEDCEFDKVRPDTELALFCRTHTALWRPGYPPHVIAAGDSPVWALGRCWRLRYEPRRPVRGGVRPMWGWWPDRALPAKRNKHRYSR